MDGKTNKERLSVLEAQRDAHEDRHTASEDRISDAFDRVDKGMEKGESRFDSIDFKLGEMSIVLAKHCNDTNHNDPAPTNGRKAKNIIIRAGSPMATGGGIVAIILWLIQVLAG